MGLYRYNGQENGNDSFRVLGLDELQSDLLKGG